MPYYAAYIPGEDQMKNRVTASVLACLIATYGLAQAQMREPAQDIDRISRAVKPGQQVTVTDEQGQLFSGKMDRLTVDSRIVAVDGRHVDLPVGHIVRIQRRGDNVIDRALIGFGAGATLGYLKYRADTDPRDCRTDPWFCGWSGPDLAGAAALMAGGIGVAAGVVIDPLIPANREVYRRRRETSVAVSPTVSRGARGLVVSVSW